jgi:hypothetical protein
VEKFAGDCVYLEHRRINAIDEGRMFGNCFPLGRRSPSAQEDVELDWSEHAH